jgi:hypothetical protein
MEYIARLIWTVIALVAFAMLCERLGYPLM